MRNRMGQFEIVFIVCEELRQLHIKIPVVMQLLRNLIKAHISVYDGISPALLATISLSQNIKGSTHDQLVMSLKKSNIVQSQAILSVLSGLDRAMFTSQKKVYENKPSKISKGQNMTDIFSHSIILNNIEPQLKLKPEPKILDIGTGHGYLAFAIWMLAVELSKSPKQLLAIDCFDECIEKCHKIKTKLKILNDEFEFKKMDVMEVVQKSQKFDIIVGGFFIQPNLSTKLQLIMEQDGLGIWPQVSQAGQGLFITRKNNPKQYLLQTLFSQQVVQSSVEEYFISQHGSSESDENNQLQKGKQVSQAEKKAFEDKVREQRTEKKRVLQNKLKQTIQNNQKSLNVKTLTLRQMQTIPEISYLLEELKKYK